MISSIQDIARKTIYVKSINHPVQCMTMSCVFGPVVQLEVLFLRHHQWKQLYGLGPPLA